MTTKLLSLQADFIDKCGAYTSLLPLLLILCLLVIIILSVSLCLCIHRLRKCRKHLVRYINENIELNKQVPPSVRSRYLSSDEVTPYEFTKIIDNMLKRMIFLSLALLLMLPMVAQETVDSVYKFRFTPTKDVFYVPYKGNGSELNRLCDSIALHIDRLRAGQMYISVSSYAASPNEQTSALRMGYLRNSRVKSELITRAGVTEQMFVTDRLIPTAYKDSLRNVVVVVFPANVETVKRIAGIEAATKVEAYIEEVTTSSTQARQAAQAQRQAALRAEQERKARQDEAERRGTQQQQAQQQAEAERQRLAAEAQAHRQAPSTTKLYTLALRANLLRWATLTPNLGIEWRINRHWGVAVDGSWTSWSRDNSNRRYALWNASPAIHYYIGKQKQGHLGAQYHTGEFNYKLSATGKQGSYQGGGITGGYSLPIGKCLMLDFSLGVGYTRADYEKYTLIDAVRVRQGKDTKNYWGINQAGVTLVWKLF